MLLMDGVFILGLSALDVANQLAFVCKLIICKNWVVFRAGNTTTMIKAEKKEKINETVVRTANRG